MNSSDWKLFSSRLKDKKVIVIWGQSVTPLKETEAAENNFCRVV